jgi:phosphomannomutase / phosphoglucomutase
MKRNTYAKRLFGTNGVRGIVGKEITPELVLHIGEAFGSMRPGHIAVGRDTRTSGETLILALKSGLLATGCDVVDCGILPTPALQFLVKEEFDGGAMITASHNPPEYNGVKIIEPDGTEMSDEEIILLEQRLFDQSFSLQPWNTVGREVNAPDLVDHYINAIAGHFPPGIGKGMLVAVDPGSGPACVTTPEILKKIGCRVMTVHGVMDGTFPGRLPEPSMEGLKALSSLVVSSGASFGVAHDGDADRAVFVDENGTYIEENQEFALVAQHICHQQKGIVVTPVSTSQLVEAVAAANNCSVVYTKVGSIYVARTMHSLINKGKKVVFGGEGNGGLIFPDHQFCRDGGMTAAMMVAILSKTNGPLSDLVARLPKRFMIKDKIATPDARNVVTRLKQHFSHDRIDRTDGLKITRNSTSALVRASGTEPIIRIIVESDQKGHAESLYRELKKRISACMGTKTKQKKR